MLVGEEWLEYCSEDAGLFGQFGFQMLTQSFGRAFVEASVSFGKIWTSAGHLREVEGVSNRRIGVTLNLNVL